MNLLFSSKDAAKLCVGYGDSYFAKLRLGGGALVRSTGSWELVDPERGGAGESLPPSKPEGKARDLMNEEVALAKDDVRLRVLDRGYGWVSLLINEGRSGFGEGGAMTGVVGAAEDEFLGRSKPIFSGDIVRFSFGTVGGASRVEPSNFVNGDSNSKAMT